MYIYYHGEFIYFDYRFLHILEGRRERREETIGKNEEKGWGRGRL